MGPPNTGWTHILYFTDQTDPLGFSVPSFLLTPGNYLRCITLIGTKRDFYLYNTFLKQDIYTKVTMEQRMQNGNYYVSLYINDTKTVSKLHLGYRSFPLVSVKPMLSEKGARIKDFDYGKIA